MGSPLSTLRSTAKAVHAAVKILVDLNTQYQGLVSRVNKPAGIPVPAPTESYWLQDPPFPELVDVQSPELARYADVVVIGSGITGAAVARGILLGFEDTESTYSTAGIAAGRRRTPKVVVLEARQLCSGATGRNGGHIKASPYETFSRLSKSLPPERAAALTRFQLRHLGVLTSLCEEMGLEAAECRTVESVDLFLDEEGKEVALKSVEEVRKWIPEVEMRVWDAEGAREVSLLSSLHFFTGSIMSQGV
jgi:glycine/D-amino acid oxidase-like deaminating enzyme